MVNARFAGLGLALVTIAMPANATVLLASGQFSGSTDKSGLSYTLENGLPANFLGGLGSGLAWAGSSTFYGLPDRGPNATVYNSLVDDTVSYVARFSTLHLGLAPSASGSALPFALTPSLQRTTLLYSSTPLVYGSGAGLGVPSGDWVNEPGKYYFTGRSDNFGAGNSLSTDFARLDPEAIRVSNDGKSVFVSDEYGPYVRQFDSSTGELIKTFTLPGELAIDNLSPNAAVERTGNIAGRYTNSGMEGLAITPDGKTLVGIVQGALLQDRLAGQAKLLHIVTIDIATGATKQFAYTLSTGTGVSEIVALNDHQFLVDERDGNGLGGGACSCTKDVFLVDLAGATEITGLTTAQAAAAVIGKTKVADVAAALTAAGLPIPSKLEGLAFGEDVDYLGQTYHTLFVSDDNDFLPAISGDNHFYVFGLTDDDLAQYGASFTPQDISAVPEPASWAMLIAGFAFVGATIRLRRRKVSLRYA